MMPKLFNRELSQMDFNDRVLAEASDETVPLLQRLRFLGIYSSNEDEFFKVRVSALLRQMKDGKGGRDTSGSFSVGELYNIIDIRAKNAQKQFSDLLARINQGLADEKIHFLKPDDLNARQKRFCRDYYSRVVSVRLAPIMLHRRKPMPFLPDDNCYLIVRMVLGEYRLKYALLRVPVSEACPRFVVLPSDNDQTEIIWLDDLIRLCLEEIFFMFDYRAIDAYSFMIIRDANLVYQEEDKVPTPKALKKGLDARRHGWPIRMSFDREMPQDALSLLSLRLGLSEINRLVAGERYQLLKNFADFQRIRPDLEESIPDQIPHPSIKPNKSVLEAIAQKDILLHYPYHSFSRFLDFLREAAIDPRVRTIYITLYRTAEHSKVVTALLNAANNGKKVVANVELLARFDEEQNIETTEYLRKGGVTVYNGVTGLKVHSKLVLVERKEGGKLAGYVYVGTGNFNENSAKIYSDVGLLTVNPDIVHDARLIFRFLKKRKIDKGDHEFSTLLVSPFNMRERLITAIKRETNNARDGKPAFIHAKCNNLTDEEIIDLFYEASEAGVDVRLIVRSACCLRPEVRGLSDSIRAISIVDKFLEHARMLLFANGGEEEMFILSADLMTRNLGRRVEVGSPVLDPDVRQNIRDIFDLQWHDSVKARTLAIPGENVYVTPPAKGGTRVRSQMALFDYYQKRAKAQGETSGEQST